MATTRKPAKPKSTGAKTTTAKPAAASGSAKPAFGSPAWRAKYMKNGGKKPTSK